jgi:enoyl reductase
MRRLLAISTMVVAMLAAGVTPALADPPSGSGGGNGSRFWVESLVRVRGPGHNSGGRPNVPADFNPPRCWYQPEYTYDEMMEFADHVYFIWLHQGRDEEQAAIAWYRQTLDQIKPHAGESGKIFWFLTDDGTDAGSACYASTDPFWIYVGPQPPAAPGDKIIDPTDLAKIARANLTLPKPKITLNPPGQRSFVGLETWVGVDDPPPTFREAFVVGFPQLRARIDAVPSTVTIDVNGADATVHAGRTRCPAWHKGIRQGSGCWVRFNRSSLGAPYTITVTRRWTVTTNVAGVVMPPGIVSAATTLVVDEIQSNVVR